MAVSDGETLSRSASPVVVPPVAAATALANSVSQTSSVQKVNINLNKRALEPHKQHSPLGLNKPQQKPAIKQPSPQSRPQHLQPHPHHQPLLQQQQQQQQQRYAKIQPAIKPRPIAVLPKPLNAVKSKFDPSVPTTSQIKSSLHNNTPLNINTSKKWILPPRPRPGRKPTASASGGSLHTKKSAMEHTVSSHAHLHSHPSSQSQLQAQLHAHPTGILSAHTHSNSIGHSQNHANAKSLSGLSGSQSDSFQTPRKASMPSPPPSLKTTKKPIKPMSSLNAKHTTTGQVPHPVASSGLDKVTTTPHTPLSQSHVSQPNSFKKSVPSSALDKKLNTKKKLKPMTKESDNETIINQLKQQYPQKQLQSISSKSTQPNSDGLKSRQTLSSFSDTTSSILATPSVPRAAGSPIPIQSKSSQTLNPTRKISPAPGPLNSVGSLSGVTSTPSSSEPKRTLLDLKGIYLNKLKEQELIRNYIDVINNQIKELNFVKNGVITFAALDGNNSNTVAGNAIPVESGDNSSNESGSNTVVNGGELSTSTQVKNEPHAGSKSSRKPVSCEQLELINNLNDLNKFLTYFLRSSSIIHSATKKYVNGNKPSGSNVSNTAQDKSDAKSEHKRQLDVLDQQIRYYLELRARFQVDGKGSDDNLNSESPSILSAIASDDPDGQRKLKMKKVSSKIANDDSRMSLIVEDQLVGDLESSILNALVKELSFPFGDQDTSGSITDGGILEGGKNVIRNDVLSLLPPGGINSLLSPSSFAPNLFKSMSLQDDELIDFLNSESEKTEGGTAMKASISNENNEKPNDKENSPLGKRFTSPLLAQYERQLGDDIGSELFGDDDNTPMPIKRLSAVEKDLDNIMNLNKLMLHDEGPSGSLSSNKPLLVDDFKATHESVSEELKMHSLFMDQDSSEMGNFFGLRGFSSPAAMGLNGSGVSRNKCGFCGSDSPCFCLEGDIM